MTIAKFIENCFYVKEWKGDTWMYLCWVNEEEQNYSTTPFYRMAAGFNLNQALKAVDFIMRGHMTDGPKDLKEVNVAIERVAL